MWPFTPGALFKDTAQAQDDKDCQRREDDGVNIHVAFQCRTDKTATGIKPTDPG